MDVDTLWQLKGDRDRTPQWHPFDVPVNSDDEEQHPKAIKKQGKQRRKLLALKDHTDSDTNGSIPELLSVSDSSEDVTDDNSTYGGDEKDTEDDHSEAEDSDDSGYNTDQEDELRGMWRDAMDIAHEADFFNSTNITDQSPNLFAEERKGNPFLKLLGSLRGWFFIRLLMKSIFMNTRHSRSYVLCQPKTQNRESYSTSFTDCKGWTRPSTA